MTMHNGVHPSEPSVSNGNGTGSSSMATTTHHILGVLRRWWWVVAAAVIGSVSLTWWMIHDRTEVYTAEVLIRRQADDPLFSVGMRTDAASMMDFGAELEILRSRAVLSAVVDSLGLQLNLRTHQDVRADVLGRLEAVREPAGGAYLLSAVADTIVLMTQGDLEVVSQSADAPVSGPGFTLQVADPAALPDEPVEFNLISHDAAVERLENRVLVEQGKGIGLIWIRYTDPDPRIAAAVANGVAESYRDYGVWSARENARKRRESILTQLVKLADSVQTAQAAMLDYQERQQLIDPNVEGNALLSSRLQTENDLRTLRFQEGLLRSLSAGLQSENLDIAGLQQLVVRGREVVPAGIVLHQRLQDLQSDRSRLTASTFGATSGSPQVQVVDSLIAGTREEMRVATDQALQLVAERIDAAEERLGQVEQQIGTLPTRAAGVTRLQQQVDRVQRVFDSMVGQYFEAEIAESAEDGDTQVVDPAYVPLRPDPSMDGLNLLIALLAGLVVGGLGAAGLDALDGRVRDPKEAGRAARLVVIGTIPNFKAMRGDRAASAMVIRDSLRGVWTNLGFVRQHAPKVLAITSAAPREGKTTVATNLALALAEQGTRILLIDADVRRPAIHTIFATHRSPGLTDVLNGTCSLDEAVQSVSPAIPSLQVLAAGEPVDDHAALFDGRRFPRLIQQVRGEYDLVLVDMPPVLAVVESLPIAKHADGAMLVARADATDAASLSDAAEQLRMASIPLMGLVTNAVSLSQTPYYRYKEYYSRKKASARRYQRDLVLWKLGGGKKDGP
jgi:tyrosine-protein kinase Etk/Wzc